MISNFSRAVANGAIDSQDRRPTGSERNQLSFAQQRLWFLAQLRGASEAYHISSALRLVGSLDGFAVRRALDRIVQRHGRWHDVWVDGWSSDPAHRRCRSEPL